MNERTMRARLRRAGWSTTNYPCLNLLITAAVTQDPVIRPRYSVRRGGTEREEDHLDQLTRALRALRLGFAFSRHDNKLVLDERSMRILRGIKDDFDHGQQLKQTQKPER